MLIKPTVSDNVSRGYGNHELSWVEALTSLQQKTLSDRISKINIDESPAVLVKNNLKVYLAKDC